MFPWIRLGTVHNVQESRLFEMVFFADSSIDTIVNLRHYSQCFRKNRYYTNMYTSLRSVDIKTPWLDQELTDHQHGGDKQWWEWWTSTEIISSFRRVQLRFKYQYTVYTLEVLLGLLFLFNSTQVFSKNNFRDGRAQFQTTTTTTSHCFSQLSLVTP